MKNDTATQPQSYLTAKGFCITSAFWFVIATFVGLLAATKLIAPDFLGSTSWTSFGRIRPIHVNLVLFGFVTPGLLSSAFYFVPRLLRTELYSDKLGVLTVFLWNRRLGGRSGHAGHRTHPGKGVCGTDLVPGYASGDRLCSRFLQSAHDRSSNAGSPCCMFPYGTSAAAVILTAVTYCLGNVIWNPDTGALLGIPDAILLWFYGHNIFGLLLTPLSIGVAYYVIPRACGNPLYSHTLSLLGFWSLIVVYTHIGTHHLLQVPVPTWLKVIAIVDSVAMVIPVMVFLINIWYTAKGKLGEVHADIGAKFIFHRHHHVFFREHPGLHDGPAPGAAGNPLQQLGRRPCPHRGSGLFRDDCLGRSLLHPPENRRETSCTAGFWRIFNTG